MRESTSSGYRITRRDGRRCGEHQYKAERALGRRLRRGEVVHHINGDKLDNENSNLLVCSRGYHRWLHEEMGRRYMALIFGGCANRPV